MAIAGLTPLQALAVAQVKVGDLLLIQKLEHPFDPDEEFPEEEDDYEEEDEEGGEGDGEEDEGGEGDGEDADEEDDEIEVDSELEDDADESSDQQVSTDDTSESEAPVSVTPRIYVVSSIEKDDSGDIVDIEIVRLHYSSTAFDDHTYCIYGKRVKHQHPTTCDGGEVDECHASKITDVLASNLEIIAKPSGDVVRAADQDVYITNPHGKCITGCSSGFLSHTYALQTLFKDYVPPTTALGVPLPQSFQLPVCPVCTGRSTFKEQQRLQLTLMATNRVDMGQVVEYLGKLNRRRRELGYAFEQFDEREWGFAEFDDMLSDEEGEYDDEGGRWQQWQAAMDPNAEITTRPASTETIAALPRKSFKEVKGEEDEVVDCMFCTETLKDDSVVMELPCGHSYYHEDCIEQWLKQFNNCPTCRGQVPAVTEADGAKEAAAVDGTGEVETGGADEPAVDGTAEPEYEADGDAVMSDTDA